MNQEVMQTKESNEANFRSCRFSEGTWKKGDSILSEINGAFDGKRRINWDKLLDLALDLVTEDHKQCLRRNGRTERERLQIWKQIYSKKIGQTTEDAFFGFVMSDDFQVFKKKYAREFEAVA